MKYLTCLIRGEDYGFMDLPFTEWVPDEGIEDPEDMKEADR